MIKMSVFLSSDYKNTVSLEGTPAEIAENIAIAKSLFQKIVAEYGTKLANGHVSPPSNIPTVFTNQPSVSTTSNGHSNGYSKPRNTCLHAGGTKILTSGSEKNPGRKFVACAECGAYQNWLT